MRILLSYTNHHTSDPLANTHPYPEVRISNVNWEEGTNIQTLEVKKSHIIVALHEDNKEGNLRI